MLRLQLIRDCVPFPAQLNFCVLREFVVLSLPLNERYLLSCVLHEGWLAG